MVLENMDFIAAHDPEVGAAVRAEYDRQCRNIEQYLIGYREIFLILL